MINTSKVRNNGKDYTFESMTRDLGKTDRHDTSLSLFEAALRSNENITPERRSVLNRELSEYRDSLKEKSEQDDPAVSSTAQSALEKTNDWLGGSTN